MAVGDIVPVPGAQFEETLALASSDMLREMVRGSAQRMMDAEVEARCGAGYGEVTPERVNSRNGYRMQEWDTRAAGGHREILGIDVTSSEDGAGWLAFLRGLVARGLSGNPRERLNKEIRRRTDVVGRLPRRRHHPPGRRGPGRAERRMDRITAPRRYMGPEILAACRKATQPDMGNNNTSEAGLAIEVTAA